MHQAAKGVFGATEGTGGQAEDFLELGTPFDALFLDMARRFICEKP